MFSRCKIARTPGIFSAAAVSILTTRPWAIVASTGTAYNIPGKWKSAAYCAIPLTFNGPSTRGVLRPIGDTVAVCVAGIFVNSLGWWGRVLQRMHEAAFGQFHFEAILTLGLRVLQRSVGCFLENGLRRRLTC